MAYVIGISSKIEFQRASSSDSIRSHSKKTSFFSLKTPCLVRQLPDGQGVFVLFLNCSGTRVACGIFLSAAGTAAATAVVAVGGIEFAFGAQAGTPLSGASTDSVVPSRSAFAVRLFGVGSLASDTDALQFFFDRLYLASGATFAFEELFS